MKSLKIFLLSIITFSLIGIAGCNKEPNVTSVNKDDEQLKTADFIVFCNELINNDKGEVNVVIDDFIIDGKEYNANVTETEAGTVPYRLVLTGDFEYSYKVLEQTVNNGVIIDNKKTFTGTLYKADFSTTELNKIEIVRNNSGWSLKMKSTPNNGGGSSGVWQRFGSPNGYQTDLAIGNISGEPANRVYMCEHPGSPSAGLYKGYINGETITWDAVHGMPNAKFYERDGVMRLWFSIGPEDDAGRYQPGAWTNTCGKLENSVKKILIVLNKSESPSLQVNSVTIEGVDCFINKYMDGEVIPDCQTGKTEYTPSSSANPGYYMVSITFSAEGINGPYTKTDQSVLHKSTLSNGCTRLRATNSTTGRWVLLPL